MCQLLVALSYSSLISRNENFIIVFYISIFPGIYHINDRGIVARQAKRSDAVFSHKEVLCIIAAIDSCASSVPLKVRHLDSSLDE